MRNSWALLPSGKVNLKTAESTYFNVIENNDSSIGSIVLIKRNGTKFVACSSAGGYDYLSQKHPVGSHVNTHHDQTGRPNHNDIIVGYFTSDKKGFEELLKTVGKTLISFSVFK